MGGGVEVTVTEDDTRQADPQALARMLQVGASGGERHGGERHWEPNELGAILRHQLGCPVRFDLDVLGPRLAAQATAVTEARGLLLKSFGDLIFHPDPTIELLKLTKEYARACRAHPDSLIPSEVATALYYAAIVAARLRCGARITELDDATVRQGIEWLIRQPWIEPSLRTFFEHGLAAFPHD